MKTNEKNLNNSQITFKINHTFTFCLKMKNLIAGPCFPVYFVGLRLDFDVLEQIAPLCRWLYLGASSSVSESHSKNGKNKNVATG